MIDRLFFRCPHRRHGSMSISSPVERLLMLSDHRAFVLDHGIVGDSPNGDLVSVL